MRKWNDNWKGIHGDWIRKPQKVNLRFIMLSRKIGFFACIFSVYIKCQTLILTNTSLKMPKFQRFYCEFSFFIYLQLINLSVSNYRQSKCFKNYLLSLLSTPKVHSFTNHHFYLFFRLLHFWCFWNVKWTLLQWQLYL